MICAQCNQEERCICIQQDPAPAIPAPSLDLFHPAHFAALAQDIFKATSLTPFDPEKPNPGIQRISHGAMHHARVAIWVRIFAHIAKAQGLDIHGELSERNIRLLEYVALFHDAARENDHGKDIWEEKSAALCQDFLSKNNIEEAVRFSNAIIKKEPLGLFEKILQSADCLDIMRCKKVFQIERISLFADLEEKNEEIQEEYILSLVKEAGKLIQAQSDMKEDVWVTLHGKKVMAFTKSRDAENPALKEKYELAENCYEAVKSDVEKQPWLQDLHAGSVHPCVEIEEKEEGENFFEQPEILGYTFIVQDALPAKEALVQGEIYLHKIGSRLTYIFLTPDGEVAEGYISRKAIPLPADFSQKTITADLEETLLQWLLKKETGIIIQKAVRVDQYIYIDTFIPMVGKEMHYAAEEKEEDGEEEKQEEDAAENAALDKIILRKARQEKKGVYIPKRGKAYVSDIEETGNLVFYGTNPDGTSNGEKLQPYYTKAQKEGSSKPQSVSPISDKIPEQPVFGFGREGVMPPIVVLFPHRATLSHGYYSRYDGGTVGRREFGSYEEVKGYIDSKYGGEDPIIRTVLALFMQDLAAGKNIGNYSEALMRLKWVDYAFSLGQEKKIPKKGEIHFWREGNQLAYTVKSPSKKRVVGYLDENHLQQMGLTLDTLSKADLVSARQKLLYALRVRGYILKPCCLGLPKNHTVSSRIFTQYIAESMEAYMGQKPDIVYMADFPKKTLYTESAQERDRIEAEQIAQDPEELSKALERKDFYFLLKVSPEKLKEILDTHPKAKLMDLYVNGHVYLAKQLALRAEIDLEKIIRGVDWSNVQKLHPVAIQDLAFTCSDLYKTLPANVVNAPDAEGNTVLDAVLSFGRLRHILALLEHDGIMSRGRKKQEIGGRLLVDIMRKGYRKTAQTLFEKGYGLYALAHAGRQKDDEKIFEAILEVLMHTLSIEVHAQDREGRRIAMSLAEEEGYTEIKVLPEQAQINPNARDGEGKTLCIWAAKNGYTAHLKTLLTQPEIDPHCTDRYEKTALIYAAENGHAESVKALLGAGAHPNHRDGYQKTALMYAIKNGHMEVVEVLLAHQKTDPNCSGEWGKTALIYATESSHAGMVRALLARSETDPNAKDYGELTALIHAARWGYMDIVKALLAVRKNGIQTDPNLQDGAGNTALISAVNGKHIEVVEALLAHRKIDPNLQAKDHFNRTALIYAARSGRKDIVLALCRHPKTNPNLKDETGETALMYAVKQKSDLIVDTLLAARKGIQTDPNLQDKKGNTALMLAAKEGNIHMVQALLNHPKTKPDLKNKANKTALIWAAENGHTELMRIFLTHPKTNKDAKSMQAALDILKTRRAAMREKEQHADFSSAAAVGDSLSKIWSAESVSSSPSSEHAALVN